MKKSGRYLEANSVWCPIMCKRAFRALQQFAVRKRIFDHFGEMTSITINKIILSKENEKQMITDSVISDTYDDSMSHESLTNNTIKNGNCSINGNRQMNDVGRKCRSIKKCEMSHHIAMQAVKRQGVMQWIRAMQRYAHALPCWSVAVTHFSSSGHFQRMSRVLYRIQNMQKR